MEKLIYKISITPQHYLNFGKLLYSEVLME